MYVQYIPLAFFRYTTYRPHRWTYRNLGLFQVGEITQFGTALVQTVPLIIFPIAGILDGKRKAAFKAESQAG